MIVIYDFDGTLTPYPLPKYEIFKKCGIDEIEGAMRGKLIMEEENLSLYEAYFEAYRRYLKENNIPFNRESICLGADKVELNDGVIEYFKDLCSTKTGIKHYVVTSGFEEYIRDTKINPYLDGVYGSTFTVKNGVYDTLEVLMDEEYKIEAIKNIVEINNADIKDVIYFGDGLTDKDAFKYVHDNGGKSIFVRKNKENDEDIKILRSQGIIDYCFDLKYGKDSEIYNFIKNYK